MNRKEEMELLPCPFCGGEAVDRREIDGFPMIYCNGDDCFGPQTTASSFDDALVQWNTRAALRASAAPEEGASNAATELDDPRLMHYALPSDSGRLTCTCGQAGHGNAHEPGCPLSSYTGPTKYPRQTFSDSGKAAPVAWRWKAKGNKHWIYDPAPEWRADHQDDPEIEFQPLYAALAPATEGMETLKPDRNLARLLRAAVDDGLFANNPDAEPVIQKWFEAHCEPWPEAPAISSADRKAEA